MSVPNNPIKHVCQVKYLNDGLKLGAPVNSMPRHARFVAKYDSMKRTELIWAIVLRDPINSINCTKNQLVKTATIGLPFHVPFVTNPRRDPKTRSLAKASKTRLDPIKLLKAAENVAVMIPIAINGFHTFIGIKNRKLYLDNSRGVVAAIKTASAM